MTMMMVNSGLKHLIQLYSRNREFPNDQILTKFAGILSSSAYALEQIQDDGLSPRDM